MNEPVEITRKQALPIIERAFPEYNGRKIKVEFTEKMYFHDLNWHGGTHADYVVLRSDGTTRYLEAVAPWREAREGACVDLPPNVIVVRHYYFCGKDDGLTIYAHPSIAPRLIEAPKADPEMTNKEKVALRCAVGAIASYRRDLLTYNGISTKLAEELYQSLAAKGMVKINKAGSVQPTSEGRNWAYRNEKEVPIHMYWH